MKEFIEKLIGRLGEQQAEAENEMHRLRSGDYTLPCSYDITDIKEIASESFKESIQIVNELAEEYSANTPQNFADGWIPCSEELPEEDKIVLLCTKDKLVRQGVRHISYEHNRYDLYGVTSTFWDEDIVAWQPLPKPYKE